MIKKKIAVFLTMIVVSLLIAVPVVAKPYNDLWLGGNISNSQYKNLKYLKKHHAFDGVIKKGGNFRPGKTFTGKQIHKIFVNLFGKKNVPKIKADKKRWNRPYRSKDLVKKIEAVSKKMGKPIRWFSRGCNLEVLRRDVCDF